MSRADRSFFANVSPILFDLMHPTGIGICHLVTCRLQKAHKGLNVVGIEDVIVVQVGKVLASRYLDAGVSGGRPIPIGVVSDVTNLVPLIQE